MNVVDAVTKQELYKRLIKVASLSNCTKRKVGAILARPLYGQIGRVYDIFAEGYNHMPNGGPCECTLGQPHINVRHAEVDCLEKCKHFNYSDAIMYITYEPCSNCQNYMLVHGVTKYEVLDKPPKEKIVTKETMMTTDIKDTLQARGSVYGAFKDNARLTQALIQHIACGKGDRVLADFEWEALHMICHKISRIACGEKTKKDNWHDIAGYAKLAEDLTIDG